MRKAKNSWFQKTAEEIERIDLVASRFGNVLQICNVAEEGCSLYR